LKINENQWKPFLLARSALSVTHGARRGVSAWLTVLVYWEALTVDMTVSGITLSARPLLTVWLQLLASGGEGLVMPSYAASCY